MQINSSDTEKSSTDTGVIVKIYWISVAWLHILNPNM